MIDLCIVGSGRMAGALAIALSAHGVHVTAIAGRSRAVTEELAALIDSRAIRLEQVAHHNLPVLIVVSDDAVARVAREIGPVPVVLHTSGAAGPDVLADVPDRSAFGVLHPLQTVPSWTRGAAALPGSAFAYAGDEPAKELARALIQQLGGKALPVPPERWPFYHAAAVMASNYQMALLDASLELMEGAGIARDVALDALAPLVRESTDNAIELTPAEALTGPIRRGDIGTVLRHLRALRNAPPAVRNLYAAAGLQTVSLAQRAGLPSGAAQEIAEALACASVQ